MRLSVAPGLKDCNCNGVGGHRARRREAVFWREGKGSGAVALSPISLGIEQNGVPLPFEAANANDGARQPAYFDGWQRMRRPCERVSRIEEQIDRRIHSRKAPEIPYGVFEFLFRGNGLRQYPVLVGPGQQEPSVMVTSQRIVGQ